MRGTILILLLLASSVFALSGPFTNSGKEYYVVTSTDPSEDSGDEVCAKVGKACIGYTESTNAVCKLVHSGAADSAGLSGDAAGTYCNGAPQSGACSALTDTCLTCPTCTNSVTCSQAIGGLYREMYVECGSGKCKVTIFANNFQDLVNQVTGINAQLQGCPQSIPAPADKFVKNGNTFADITRTSGSVETFTITATNKQITGVQAGAIGSCVQRIAVSENDLNNALNSQDLGKAVAYLVGQNRAKISGCTFVQKFKLFFAKPIIKFAAKKIAPTPPPPKPAPNCGQVGEQCNNRACFSGMCGAPKEQNNGQWGFWNYRCIDQQTYTANCVGRGNTPPAWSCLIGPCR